MISNRKLFLFITTSLLILISLNISYAKKYSDEYKWVEYKNDDVTVLFPQGYQKYANYISSRAHTHLDSLHSWYGIRPKITRIILNPDHDMGIAMATLMPSRIEIQLNPVMDKGLRPQSGIYLDRVLAHELTHLVQFTKATGFSLVARKIFGGAIAPLGLAPIWVTEGQAVWTESFNGGGRLNSSYQKMLYNTPLAEGSLWDHRQAAVYGSVQPPAGRAYISGTFLYSELATSFVAYKDINKWMKMRSNLPLFQNRMFKKAFNRSVKELFDKYESNSRADLRTMMNRRYKQGYAVGNRLEHSKRSSYNHPDWSSDGKLFVYLRSYDKTSAYVELGGDKLSVVNVKHDLGYTSHTGLTAVDDGIVISQIHRTASAPEASKSRLIFVDNKGRHHNVQSDSIKINGWAPDYNDATGELVFVTRLLTGALAIQFGKYQSSTILSKLETVVYTDIGNISDPKWNKDGSQIAFAADLGEGEKVYIWNRENNYFVQLTIDGAKATWDPCFSPQGSLWVSADREDIFDLFEIDLSKKQAVRRTRVLTGAMEPSVSPNGKMVAYSHYTSEGFSLALLDSTNWLSEPTEVNMSYEEKTIFNSIGLDLFRTPPSDKIQTYEPLLSAKPTFWMPSYYEDDYESRYGAIVNGRDPLGLFRWQLGVLRGAESEMTESFGSIKSRGPFSDVTIGYTWEPAYITGVEYYLGTLDGDPSGELYEKKRLVSEWQSRIEGRIVLSQVVNNDWNGNRMYATPFFGITSRERFSHNRTSFVRERYDNWLVGFGIVSARRAQRDPVSRSLTQLYFSLENTFATSGEVYFSNKFDNTLMRVSMRKHLPGWRNGTVFAFTGRFIYQRGIFDKSLTSSLPRGYVEDDIHGLFHSSDGAGTVGSEFHFPLLFPEVGLGTGWAFLSRIRGTLFAEFSSDRLRNKIKNYRINENLIASYGAEIGMGTTLFYGADLDLTLGMAWKSLDEESKFYFRLGIPMLSSLAFE
jgi:hypothetical protein